MIRWGILGTGGVANVMADALAAHPDATVAAVGSRAYGKAEAFAARHDGNAYGDYPDAVNDPSVDAVYVATPTSHHYEHTLLALRAGKHVLCEKSFAVNGAQAKVMVAEARERGLFLMEAMWSRFTPAWCQARRIVASGELGDLVGVEASFGGKADYNPRVRAFRSDLAGGALLDTVVYPIHFAQMLMVWTDQIRAVGKLTDSGVDEHAAVLMDFCGGRYGVAMGGIRSAFSGQATVYGTEGMLTVPTHIDPTWMRLDLPGRDSVTIEAARDRHRFAYQLDEAHRCIAAGEESRVMPLGDTLEVMHILDRAREEIGLRFPDEVEAL